MSAGNYKDAFEQYRRLALDPKEDRKEVCTDLYFGVNCLYNLGRVDEADDFREQVIAAHKDNWRLLEAAAQSYVNTPHFGFIIAGKFDRGGHRGGGRYVSTFQRDRVRALQLMQQGLPLVKKEKDAAAVAAFHLHFAEILLHGAGYYEAWRLQYYTNLVQLPDYDDGYNNYDVRHNFNLSALYTFPGTGALKGGWSVGGAGRCAAGAGVRLTPSSGATSAQAPVATAMIRNRSL